VRDEIVVRIAGQLQGEVEVRAGDDGGVWLKLLDPDGDDEVRVSCEVLQDALAYVSGGYTSTWEPKS